MPISDLVLEGGGVKGAGLAGAVSPMVERDYPYVFHRIARDVGGRNRRVIPGAGNSPQ